MQVYEGYGQTEGTAGTCFTLPGDFSTGHVGPPLPCNAIKLVDVEDMNYFADNQEGEVKRRNTVTALDYLSTLLGRVFRFPRETTSVLTPLLIMVDSYEASFTCLCCDQTTFWSRWCPFLHVAVLRVYLLYTCYLFLGLFQGPQCVQGLLEGSQEDGGNH